MSGSSAVASARRRRAEPIPQTITSSGGNPETTQQIKNNDDSVQKQSATPLQILQVHDKKIKELEDNLEETIVEISKKVLAENLKQFNLDKPQPVVNNKVEFDSRPLIEKYESLSSKFDELKTLFIKSQMMSIETNTEMLRIKDKVLEVEEYSSQIELQLKKTEQNENNLFNMDGDNGDAEMFLRSMMQSAVMGNSKDDRLNIHDNDTDEESNELGDVSEITLSESELDKLKTEVTGKITELSEDSIKPDEPPGTDLIEVSENEDEVEVKN